MYRGYGNNFYTLASQSVKSKRQRTLFTVSVFILLYLIIIVRLAQVMIFQHVDETSLRNSILPISVTRADIIDRNGTIIATSLPTVSLYACPHEVLSVEEAVSKISLVFSDINKNELTKKLKTAKKFLWIKRNLSPTQEQAVLNQGIPGFHFVKTERRVYPDKNLLAHIIGGTDIDNVGIAGIEKVFDETLRNSKQPLKLAIDTKIQHAVRDELMKSIHEFHALGGAAVVMNIENGEILSLVSLPDFDPNKSTNPTSKEHFNMVTSSAIEPGSTAKIFNTAMALESGKITPFTKFDARFPLKLGRFTIHDFKGKGTFLTVEEILKYSSNIGSAKIAQEIGNVEQKKFFQKLGLLETVSCELAETQRPIYPKVWSEASAITIAFGHGIALSPLHLITTMSGILNNGVVNEPTLLKRDRVIPGRRILSEKVSNEMKALMRINVTEGANKYAEVKGYCVGGKSGTAEKPKKGRYSKTANYAGFVGAFPMTNPKYTVYVVLDEPQATAKTHGYRTAGWNSAPTAGHIIRRIAPILGIMMSTENEPDWHEVLRKLQ